MRVRCISNRCRDGRTAALSVGESYEVLGIEADYFRVIDDTGDPVLFEPSLFERLDDTRPAEWTCEFDEGVEYAGPAEFARPGFWEAFHEHDAEARSVYSRYLNRHLRTTDAA